jgi:imidazolonepropionase-like amidohydrolase
MITPPGGYPTRSWGADGYGLECDGEAACVAAVDRVVDAGAAIVKVPIGAGGPDHDDATLRAIVARAHARDRLVAVHALDDASARRAAEAGADILAHTPVERLSADTVALWSTRAVISTLRAFGGTETAVDNLRRLHESGATVLYGTDLGNTRTAGIDPLELSLLAAAGLTDAEIRAAATADPARLLIR